MTSVQTSDRRTWTETGDALNGVTLTRHAPIDRSGVRAGAGATPEAFTLGRTLSPR